MFTLSSFPEQEASGYCYIFLTWKHSGAAFLLLFLLPLPSFLPRTDSSFLLDSQEMTLSNYHNNLWLSLPRSTRMVESRTSCSLKLIIIIIKSPQYGPRFFVFFSKHPWTHGVYPMEEDQNCKETPAFPHTHFINVHIKTLFMVSFPSQCQLNSLIHFFMIFFLKKTFPPKLCTWRGFQLNLTIWK